MKRLKLLFACLAGLALTGAMMPSASALAAGAQITIQWHEPGPPPGNWSHAWHRGFHAGAMAAHHDIQNGMRPDARRHHDFRHPDVPPGRRGEFRDGFMHGYQMVYHRDWHHHHHDGGY